MITDGIKIGVKHSYKDFGLVIASRNIGIPAKKIVKATIPYMNGAYDFSALNGVPVYEERLLTYGFDIAGATIGEMEVEKAAVLSWLMSAQDVDIYDDAYPDTHFHGSYDNATWTEDDSQGNILVVFKAYPFRLANAETVLEFNTAEATRTVTNDGYPVQVKINSPQGATATLGGVSYSAGSGEYIHPAFLNSGENEITVKLMDGMTYAQGSKTENGINFAVNSTDGYVTADGTADDTAWLYLRMQPQHGLLPVGEYWLSGCPDGGRYETFGITVTIGKVDGSTLYYRDGGDGLRFTVDEDVTSVYIGIFVAGGYTASSLVFYPRLYGITEVSWRKEVV